MFVSVESAVEEGLIDKLLTKLQFPESTGGPIRFSTVGTAF
jgi:hypothetical protein